MPTRSYQPTIESTYNTTINVKRGTVVLDIIDTAGMVTPRYQHWNGISHSALSFRTKSR